MELCVINSNHLNYSLKQSSTLKDSCFKHNQANLIGNALIINELSTHNKVKLTRLSGDKSSQGNKKANEFAKELAFIESKRVFGIRKATPLKTKLTGNR